VKTSLLESGKKRPINDRPAIRRYSQMKFNSYQVSHLVLWAAALPWLEFSFPAGAQPDPNDLKQRILAQAQSMRPDDYSFTRTRGVWHQ
jgi:hypothetical protein